MYADERRQSRNGSGGAGKKVVRASRRKEMAQRAPSSHGASIGLACLAFSISETCYRYQPTLSDENAEIADWLIRLTRNQKDWGLRFMPRLSA